MLSKASSHLSERQCATVPWAHSNSTAGKPRKIAITKARLEILLLMFLLAAFLEGCSPAKMPPSTAGPLTATGTVPGKTTSPFATGTPVLDLTPSATPAPVTPAAAATQTASPRLCSPLQNVSLAEITHLVSNPYHPPRPGFDDPHAGVDLAIRLPGSQVAVAGSPVRAALAGRVVMITRDRFPFGNAVLVETPLDSYPTDWYLPAEIPTQAPTLAPRSALTCPAGSDPAIPDPARRSLYILYAHLQHPSTLNPDDPVACGQEIGLVGNTGNALNPHLHFEVRVAPAGLRIPSMAHYDASASAAEMHSYCVWSVSGLFQLVDPLKILGLAP